MMHLVYVKSWVRSESCVNTYNSYKIIMLLLDYAIIELSPHIVSEAFYSGELEAELRRIGHIDYRFRYDSDRETCMEMIEKIRRKTLYEHPPADCVEECKKRGDDDT